jgi:hypothetical protein
MHQEPLLLAGVINIVGLAPYVRNIFRYKTKSEQAMWWIYAALFALLFSAQVNAGARLITAVYVLSTAIIAVFITKLNNIKRMSFKNQS